MIEWLIIGGILLLFVILASLYKIVPADMADVVIQNKKMRVYSSDKNYSEDGKSAYFRIPGWFFILNLGMKVHRIPLKILPISVTNFLAFDKDRARFECNIIAYVTVNKPMKAAQRFNGKMTQLIEDVSKVVQATTRDATTKQPIRAIINDRESIISTIKEPLTAALANWGLDLKDIELVEFKDPSRGEKEGDKPSHVISDISSIIEEQIESEATQKNAEQKKIARLKVAIAEEAAKIREVHKDEQIAMREQQKAVKVAEEQKIAKEKELDVTKVEQVKTQEIEKEKQIVVANQTKEIAEIDAEQRKAVEEINKQQKELEGQGDRVRAEAQAKGAAATVKEQGLAEAEAIKAKGLAEAEAKEKLQAALNKFGDEAIRALVAQDIVKMQQAVGVAGAKALENSDMRVFSGSDGGQGFDMGKMIESIQVSSSDTANSVLNKLARPNDLGFKDLQELASKVGKDGETTPPPTQPTDSSKSKTPKKK